jgi:hypothetical protein
MNTNSNPSNASHSHVTDTTFPCESVNDLLSECLGEHHHDWRACQDHVQKLKKCMESYSTVQEMSCHK